MAIVLQDAGCAAAPSRKTSPTACRALPAPRSSRRQGSLYPFLSLLLPDGYDTALTDSGAGLSKGQRQLLAIARAAVADPPVMILDEATSSIDTRMEALVQDGVDKLMKGQTVFVIAHRFPRSKFRRHGTGPRAHH